MFKEIDYEDSLLGALYNIIEDTDNLYFELTLEDIKSMPFFDNISEADIISCIENMQKASYIDSKFIPSKKKLSIRITLEGMIYYEKNHVKSNKIITELILKYLKLLREIEEGIIKINHVEGPQLGLYPIDKLLSYYNKSPDFNKKIEFIIREAEKKYVINNTVGLTKNGLIFHGTYMRFLTNEGRKLLKLKNIKIKEKSTLNFKFDFALSFAGEDRDMVEKIAYKLEEKGIKVFYDKFQKAELWGKDLSDYFKNTYGKSSKYVVIFISKHYEIKEWTNFEFDIARDEEKKRKEEFILPIRFDDTILFGLKSTRAILDYREEGIEEIVKLLCEKLELSNDKYRAELIESFQANLSSFERLMGLLLEEALEYSSDVDGFFLYLIDLGWLYKQDYQAFIELKNRQKMSYLKGFVPSINQLKRDISLLKGLISQIDEEMYNRDQYESSLN